MIELSTVRGTSVYVVDRMEIVNPDNVEVLRPRDRPSLTLVTCYPFYFIGDAPQRFILRAALETPGRRREFQ
jgi:sortase A